MKRITEIWMFDTSNMTQGIIGGEYCSTDNSLYFDMDCDIFVSDVVHKELSANITASTNLFELNIINTTYYSSNHQLIKEAFDEKVNNKLSLTSVCNGLEEIYRDREKIFYILPEDKNEKYIFFKKTDLNEQQILEVIDKCFLIAENNNYYTITFKPDYQYVQDNFNPEQHAYSINHNNDGTIEQFFLDAVYIGYTDAISIPYKKYMRKKILKYL